MVRRPTLDEVVPVAHALLAASADEQPPAQAVASARRLGGGTREGQTHVNLLLAQVFADILDKECSPEWRTLWGVPDVVRLTAVEDEQKFMENYPREKAARGQRVATADAKARLATAANAAILAQRFLRVRRETPEKLGEFTAFAEGATGLMVDHVWGALWIACAKVRELAKDGAN
ncbi:hypothetical protein [Streptomyces sp. NPDC001536]|uniref:hypothetical protein n=1 Tax=Streptomyces sp. NPDC001536 TaxID=3364583 RepID=UPI0036A0FE06